MRRCWVVCVSLLWGAAQAQSIPSGANPPAPAATWEAGAVPASDESDTKLQVTSPGRFSLVAHSSTGAALQLVDMLAGPGDVAGVAGAQDGRVDQLLDAGTYKLRVFAAKGATGQVQLTATAFRDVAPPRAVPPRGVLFSATLDDAQQRSFWVAVPPCQGTGCPRTLRIAATGRALADLRLWRDGRDLQELTPAATVIEPVPGHPLTELVLQGPVEPGTYLVTAYGGPASIWADGDPSRPFTLRAGVSDALEAGAVSGTIDASGSAIFAVPDFAGNLRLDLPQAAAVIFTAGAAEGSLGPKSREPSLTLPVNPVPGLWAELRGHAGQAYTIRVIAPLGPAMFSKTGKYFVSATTLGMGGDEVPPTLLLLREENDENGHPLPVRIVGSTVPHVGPKEAWRARFNVRGPSRLLVQSDEGGALALQASGVTLEHSIDPREFFDVAAGMLSVPIRPAKGSVGAIDLTIGPPAAHAALSLPWPADPVVPFGVQSIWPGQTLRLATGDAPGAAAGLTVRDIPVALKDGPLLLTQVPGQALTVPVSLPDGGVLQARSLGAAGNIDVGDIAAADGGRMVTVPAPEAPRTVVLRAIRPPPAAPDIPAPAPAVRAAPLEAGHELDFNLGTDRSRAFTLHVPDGGLFQVQTTGRLRTEGRIGTHFISSLATDVASGPGQNMLLQPWLREGDYRVRVTARNSAGHLGILANPAPLQSAPALLAGGSVRATLRAGEGVEIPVRIAESGHYRIALLGQGAGFTARFDDSEGWPLIAPGSFEGRDLDLRAGTYRLLVTPCPTAQRLVASMTRVLPPVAVTGHGPHALDIGQTVTATWREPPLGTTARPPDVFTFTLAGAAHANATVGDGMAAILTGPGGAQIRFAGLWKGVLAAGDWRLALSAQGRNDRLDYTVDLTTDELQPGRARDMALPSSARFTLAAERVVTLTTAGKTPVKAVLRNADGKVLARAGARPNDWNTALSRRLPPGTYEVALDEGLPPATADVGHAESDALRPPEDQAGDDAPSAFAGTDALPQESTATPDQPDEGGPPAPRTSLLLNLPADLPPQAAPEMQTTLAGAGVHLLSIPAPEPGSLLVASAAGAGTTLLALEHQLPGGGWQTVAQAQSAAPIAGAMAGADGRPWRTSVWSLDGDATAIAAGVQRVGQASAGRMAMLQGLPVAVGRIGLDTPIVSKLDGPAGMLQASWPGHAAVPPERGQVVPQGPIIWVVGPTGGPLAAAPVAPGALTLDIPAGAEAALPPAIAASGKIMVWRADSGDGQPAWRDGDRTGAVAPQSAVLLGGNAPVLVNAGGDSALRADVRPIPLTQLPSKTLGADQSMRLAPGKALLIRADASGQDLSITLSPGLAAFVTGPDGQRGVWAPLAPVSRVVPGGTDIVLANLGSTGGSATIAPVPHVGPTRLQAGTAEKRFYGAAGSFMLSADVPNAARLQASGDAHLLVRDAAGQVLGGTDLRPAPGPADVIVTHGPGLVVLTLESPDHSAWPDAPLVSATVPGTLAMTGAAMAVHVPADGPILLHATTTAPVLLGLAGEAPELFAAGAEFHRAVSGPVTLRLVSPHDGPLAGTLSLSTTPLGRAVEGLGSTVAVAPGGSAAFGFTLAQGARVGLGIRAEPDSTSVRLIDAGGAVIGQGTALLRDLKAGRYVIEARVPADAPATTIRPALIGTVPRPNGPPADVAASYLQMVGLKPVGAP